WGWGSLTTWGCIVGGLLVLLAWGGYELRQSSPLVDLRTMARPAVLFTNLAAVLIGFGMMAQSIVVPQLLEAPASTGYGLGQSILMVGVWMAPAGLMMLVMAPVSSRMITRLGPRLTMAAGAVVLAGGYGVALGLMDAPWRLMVATIAASFGVGIGYALMRSLGTTSAGAVMAALLTSQTQVLAPGTRPIPTATAFQLCFAVGALAALVGAGITLLVPRDRPQRSISPAAAHETGRTAEESLAG